MVQWLRLHAPNAGGLDLIPGQRTRSHMPQLKSSHATAKDPAHGNEDPHATTKTRHNQINK